MEIWYTVKIWNGYTNISKPIFGTYDQIASSLAGLPHSCIWSIE